MTDLIWKRKGLEDSDWDKHWYLNVNGFELILSQIYRCGSEMWKLECVGISQLNINVSWNEDIRAKEIVIEHFEAHIEMRIKRYTETLDILNNVKEIPSESDSDIRKLLGIIGG